MPQIEFIRGGYHERADFFGTEDVWSASSYLVKDGRSLYVIDSGIGRAILGKLKEAISRVTGVDKAYLINTHGHSDHSANNVIVSDLKQRLPEAHCYTHEGARQDTEFFLKNVPLIGKPMQEGLAYSEWLLESEAKEFDFGKARFKGWQAGDAFVLSTPGHSPDSVCVYVPGAHALFTGDTTWFVSPNNPRGSASLLLRSVANLRALAEHEHISYLGDGHKGPVIGEQAVGNYLADLGRKLQSLIAEIEKAIAGKERITINGCLAGLKKSASPAVKEALAVNFPVLPSYLDTFINVLLREKGWQRLDRNEGGTWVAPKG